MAEYIYTMHIELDDNLSDKDIDNILASAQSDFDYAIKQIIEHAMVIHDIPLYNRPFDLEIEEM